MQFQLDGCGGVAAGGRGSTNTGRAAIRHLPGRDWRHDHGAGDTLAAATACALANGYPMPEAVAFAKEWVTECLRSAYPLGGGHGPVSALWRLNP